METLLNFTTPGRRIPSHLDLVTYPERDHDDDHPVAGIGKMSTANFVLMFGILALVLLTIRAILMKTGSAKCRRKRIHESAEGVPRDGLNTRESALSRGSSNNASDSSSQSSRGFGRVTEHSIFILSPPSYDDNHQYPAAAPPPYTPGDPAPIFVDTPRPLSKTVVTDSSMSPPPYDALPNVYKPPNYNNNNNTHNNNNNRRSTNNHRTDELQRQKSNENQSTETTQL